MVYTKYSYKNDFDRPDPSLEEGLKFTEEQMEIVRQTSHLLGVEEGRSLERLEIEADLNRTLSHFEESLMDLVDKEAGRRASVQRDAAQLAKAIALKICLTESEKHAVDRVLVSFDQITQSLLEKPTITILVNPGLTDILKKRLRDLSTDLVIDVQGDESLTKLDCRFSWADGGAEMILAHSLKEVDHLISEIEDKVGVENV